MKLNTEPNYRTEIKKALDIGYAYGYKEQITLEKGDTVKKTPTTLVVKQGSKTTTILLAAVAWYAEYQFELKIPVTGPPPSEPLPFDDVE